jgi:hypothetical protein
VERLNARSFRADDLAIVEPWFEDSETQRWLGGKERGLSVVCAVYT